MSRLLTQHLLKIETQINDKQNLMVSLNVANSFSATTNQSIKI